MKINVALPPEQVRLLQQELAYTRSAINEVRPSAEGFVKAILVAFVVGACVGVVVQELRRRP